MAGPPHAAALARLDFLGSALFVNALATVIVAVAVGSFAIERLVGWAGLVAILSGLVVLAAASAFIRRHALDWQGILPISLLGFVAWSVASATWSEYHWVTASSVLYQLAFTVLAVYIALARDMIQIVRVFGNVLRVMLGASLVLEVVSGILVDSPIRLFDIRGLLAEAGPIEGLSGDSARFGIVALVAGITFFIEWRTRSVTRSVALTSLGAATALILLTHSNVVMTVAAGVALIAVVLVMIRRVRADLRQAISWIVLAAGVVVAALAVVFRSSLISVFQSSDQVVNRLGLWRSLLEFTTSTNTLEGFGWVGRWRTSVVQYSVFDVRGPFASAYNAFLDVWFQLGLIGLVLFLGLIGLALTRSWLLAVRQVSVVYLWPALIVIALIATALTESAVLVEFGWLALVICAVKSASKLSWRVAFERLDSRGATPDLR